MRGIRIFDKKKEKALIGLSEILEIIKNGAAFNWSILFLDGMPNREYAKEIVVYEREINSSLNGKIIDWENLKLLNARFFQIYETIILGCKDTKLLHRYEDENEMYRICDIVIELIDCAFWEVYSKDKNLIQTIKHQFNEVELIELA